MRIGTPELVPVRLACNGDSIEIGIFAKTEAVENEQKNRSD
jgi:hypothetical protein